MSINSIEPATFLFEDDGSIPNNPKLPLLFYAGAFDDVTPELIEETFHANQWGNNWRASVFSSHITMRKRTRLSVVFVVPPPYASVAGEALSKKCNPATWWSFPPASATKTSGVQAISQWSGPILPAKILIFNVASQANGNA